MSLRDRVRDLLVRAPTGETWDDENVEDIASLVTALAAACDHEPDGHRLMESRAATLGAYAAAMSRHSELGQGASGRALPAAGAVLEIRRGGRRRAAHILVTAGVLLVMSLGTVAASAPGGPLYDVRVAAEGLLLPQAPADRAAAQVARLQARVVEATDAAERGDSTGVSAALRAYARIATEAAAAPVVDPATLTRLEAQINAQLGAIASVGIGDPALEVVREQDRAAARILLAALGEPGDGTNPGAGPGPAASAEPSPGMTAAPSNSTPGATPGGTVGARPSPGSRASTSPGSQGSSSSPGATGAGASPGETPAPTPRADSNPSQTPGGGSGTGPAGSGGATPRPSFGRGQGGGSPSATSSP